MSWIKQNRNIFYYPSIFIFYAQVIMEKTIDYQIFLMGHDGISFMLIFFHQMKLTGGDEGF